MFLRCSEFVVLVQVPVVVEDVALPSAVVAEAEVIRPLRLVVVRLWKRLNRQKCPLDSEQNKKKTKQRIKISLKCCVASEVCVPFCLFTFIVIS